MLTPPFRLDAQVTLSCAIGQSLFIKDQWKLDGLSGFSHHMLPWQRQSVHMVSTSAAALTIPIEDIWIADRASYSSSALWACLGSVFEM